MIIFSKTPFKIDKWTHQSNLNLLNSIDIDKMLTIEENIIKHVKNIMIDITNERIIWVKRLLEYKTGSNIDNRNNEINILFKNIEAYKNFNSSDFRSFIKNYYEYDNGKLNDMEYLSKTGNFNINFYKIDENNKLNKIFQLIHSQYDIYTYYIVNI